MEGWQARTGIYIPLFIGLLLFAGGMVVIVQMINNVWLFDIERLDLARATALGRADAVTLWDGALPGVIGAFLGAVLVAVMGLVMPLVYFLNRRFGLAHAPYLMVLRQSLLLGLWASITVLLQMNRARSLAVVALVGLVLVILEFLVQVRARARQG